MSSPKRGIDRTAGQSELSSHQTLKMMTEMLSGHAGKAAGEHGGTGHAHERMTESQVGKILLVAHLLVNSNNFFIFPVDSRLGTDVKPWLAKFTISGWSNFY